VCREAFYAIAGIAPFAQAHKALVAAGAAAAIEAALAAGGVDPAHLQPIFGRVEWADVRMDGYGALLAIRDPVLADAVPAVTDDSPRCEVCGDCAAPGPLGAWPRPGCRALMVCGGCRGPERWCSKECQRKSWLEGHREVCKQRQAAAAAAAATATAEG
jgi:hypothetical protein